MILIVNYINLRSFTQYKPLCYTGHKMTANNSQTIRVVKIGKGPEGPSYFIPQNLLPLVDKDMQKVRESQSEAPTQPVKKDGHIK